MMLRSAFVGIDVAFAKKKRLPICVCIIEEGKLKPLALRTFAPKPPVGRGNKAALCQQNVDEFALEVLDWLTELESSHSLKIERIAIDAPQNYAVDGRRACEQALDEKCISCFATPTRKRFEEKIADAKLHLADPKNGQADMPHSNQFWMLVGFSLFQVLAQRYECIEVFPQAIVQTMKCVGGHKTTSAGFDEQVKAFAASIGSSENEIRKALTTSGFGSKHDRLDAWLSAWVASLPERKRTAYGKAPNDAIWVPNL